MRCVIGKGRRCLDAGRRCAVPEVPRVGGNRSIVKAGACIKIALGCRAVESEERLRCRVAQVTFACEDSEVRAEDSRFATRLDAVGVEDVAEIAADEQARGSRLQPPHTVGGVEVWIPVEVDVAGDGIE